MQATDERVTGRRVRAGAVVGVLLAGALSWVSATRSTDSAGALPGRDVFFDDGASQTCIPTTDGEKMVFSVFPTSRASRSVEVVAAQLETTGGARLERAHVAEPGYEAGALSGWPPAEWADAFEDGDVVPLPATLRPTVGDQDRQSILLFVRMPAGSTASRVTLTYREPGAATAYRTEAAQRTVLAAHSCFDEEPAS